MKGRSKSGGVEGGKGLRERKVEFKGTVTSSGRGRAASTESTHQGQDRPSSLANMITVQIPQCHKPDTCLRQTIKKKKKILITTLLLINIYYCMAPAAVTCSVFVSVVDWSVCVGGRRSVLGKS